MLTILVSCKLGNLEIFASHILYQISQTTSPSNLLDCGETSIPKFKIPLQK